MSVPCARCGREYDVTLFAFGRTLWCTCGSRVGVEPRIRRVSAGVEVRFSADAMLGKLAHWLRLLGFDCAYENGIADADLVRRAIEQGRVVLTRDRALPGEWWVPDICVVRAERTFEQLGEVVRCFDLSGAVQLFTRCSECNRVLTVAAVADLRGRAPARILATHEPLRECPGCRRVYWRGSHTRRIQRVVEQLLAAD
jgi:uncharacterized protein with PIN domain